MPSGDIYGEYSKQTRLRLHWEYTQEITNNRDKFTLKLYAQKPSGTGTHSYGYHDSVFTLTGLSGNQLINGTGDWSWGNVTEYLVGTSTFYNNHNSDGTTGNVSLSASWYTGLTSSSVIGTNMSVSGTVTGIPTIPRYANFVEHYVQSTGLNSIIVRWRADSVIDKVQYSLNGGGWTEISGYPTYTILGLNPNTQYSIKTKIRRADNGLWTESGYIYGTTKDIAKITTANDFNLGDSESISFSNPSGSTVAVALYKTDGTTVLKGYENVSGTSGLINFTDELIDTLYRLFGNNNEINIRIYLRTTSNGMNYTDYKQVTVTLTGNVKTGHINVSSNWKRTKRYTNVSGTWKRCVRWVNVSGAWKRCI